MAITQRGTEVRESAEWRDLSYIESVEPSAGTLRPTAHGATSAETRSLNGEWRFRLSATAQGDAADAVGATTDTAGWDQIEVPGHWTLQGHGAPWYTNQFYPFPVDAPNVPVDNPTATYVLDFDGADWPDSRVVLRFDGVDAVGRVWLNDRLLGTTRGSRLPQDFDVTDVLEPRRNRLVVRVHQWAGSSYLEDQDMWWLPGIFRDVTLRRIPDGGVGDVFVHADFDASTATGILRVEAAPGARVLIPELGIEILAGDQVTIDGVSPWSAESPRLYDLTVLTATEQKTLRIGFRSIQIADGLLTVNGAPLMLRGVNRHEFDTRRGRALDRAAMEADVRLMKQHNVNAVRTAHYPPAPEFLDLCDDYGLWVIDECDLETHGYVHQGWVDNPSDDLQWQPAYLDRMRRLVERDKNHPSIILWSLGNESFTGRNLRGMAEWTRDRDPSRPIHYEGDTACEYVDVFGQMYRSFEEVDQIGHGEDRIDPDSSEDSLADLARRTLPFIHTEYAHAMGNGPGGLADYRDLYERHPRCQGGFVWEWIDHGLQQVGPDGKLFFAYGGDFREPIHDGVFVIDGLLFSDRTPSPGLLEFKKVFEPFRITFADDVILVRNLHDIVGADGYRARWSLAENGHIVADGDFQLGKIDPGFETRLSRPILPEASSESVLTISVVTAQPSRWADEGHEVAWGQQVIRRAEVTQPAWSGEEHWAAVDRETGEPLALGSATFDPTTGDLLSLGSVRFTSAPVVDLWRAPTSNDIAFDQAFSQADAWRRAGLDAMSWSARTVEASEGALRIRGMLAPRGRSFGVTVVSVWSVSDDGITLQCSLTPYGPWTTTWPRVAVRFSVPSSFDGVRWYGLGPGEGYPDSRAALRLGVWSATLDELQTPYAYPQENGARPEMRRLELRSAEETLAVTALSSLGFTARPWSSETLDAAQHPYDLVAGPETVVTLDAALDGIGSASCGPPPLERDRLRPRPLELAARFEIVSLRPTPTTHPHKE